MRFFRSKSESDRLITCPSCCQLIPCDSTECSMCGADLRELPDAKREGGLTSADVAGSGSPYTR